MKHIKQLVEYITGMDTRIGYPNEHLAGDSEEEISSPMYATAVGLLMKGLRDKEKMKESEVVQSKNKTIEGREKENKLEEKQTETDKKSLFERWSDKFREFLDNAE